MAWPPPALPITISNSTEQQTNHPDLHNQTSQAVNDVVERVKAMGGYLRADAETQGATAGVYDALYFGNVLQDPDNWWNGAQIIPSETGIYLVVGYITWAGPSATQQCAAEIRVSTDGGTTQSTVCRQDAPPIGNPDLTISTILRCTGGNTSILLSGFQGSPSGQSQRGSIGVARLA